MNSLPVGKQILVKATIVRKCLDDRPEKEKGYLVKTSRGAVMIEPDEILALLKNEE